MAADPGWYPDPQGSGRRWWDGATWTAYTQADAAAAPTAPGYVTPPAAAYGTPSTPGYATPPASGYVTPPAPVFVTPPAPGYATPPASGYVTPSAPGYATPPTSAYASQPADPWAAGQVASAYGQPAASAPWAAGQVVPLAPAAPPVGIWRGPIDDRPFVPNMGVAIRTVFRKYAQFDGRAGLAEFWWWELFVFLVEFAAVFVVLVLAFIPFVGWALGALILLSFFGLIVPQYAVLVRRLRDAGYHWAWIFLGLAPFGGIVLLVLCAQRSKFP